MTRAQFAAASIVALLGITIVGAQTPAPAGPEGTASIAGAVVRDLTTEPVENAQVTLIDDSGAGPNRTISASQAGLFKFSGLRAGRYELRAVKPPFIDGSYGADRPERVGRPIVVAANAHIDDARVPMFTGAVIAGTVWSPDNQPVPRVSVVAVRTTFLTGGRRIELQGGRATTDDRGRFRIFGLPPDEYTIAAIPPTGSAAAGPVVAPIFFPGTDRYEGAARLTVNTGEQKLDTDIHVPALATRSIHVQIRAADTSDLSGQPVRFTLASLANPAGLSGGGGRSGADVVVADLVPGRYQISATASAAMMPPAGGSASLGGEAIVDVAAAGPIQDVTVLIRRIPAMSGTVTARSVASSPRENFGSVRVWLTEIGGGTVPPKRWDATGNSRFQFPAVPAGRYQIDARGIVAGGGLALWAMRSVSRDGQPIDRVIEVGESDISGLELTLVDDLATLSGSLVTGDGRPVPPYFIVLIATTPDASGVPQAYYARPAADGSYRLAGILEGDYALAVVQDVRHDDLNNPAVLASFKAAATMTLTLAPKEEKRQDLRVGYPFPLPLTFDLRPLTFPMRLPW